MHEAIRTNAELAAIGKEHRRHCTRSDQARWHRSPERPSLLELLHASNEGRVAELLPLRHERMRASTFAFFRGLPTAMAYDLATGTGSSGLRVQACGDCHLENFGIFATPERNIIFDINDFDETLPAPWEWDVKRLAVSIFIAGRVLHFDDEACARIVRDVVRTYQAQMHECADMTAIGVWYLRMHVRDVLGDLAAAFEGAAFDPQQPAPGSHHVRVAERFTEGAGAQRRIRERPPDLFHPQSPNGIVDDARGLFERYRESLRDDVELLLRRYAVVDMAVKVVGIGSVGTRCAVALLLATQDDPLILQIKEARPSILEPYAGRSLYASHGQRIVAGQQLLQAASDMFLGWSSTDDGHEYYVRQLKDMKASLDVAACTQEDLAAYAALCGRALAIAHARSGEPAALAGYLGQSGTFASAIATFAATYAEQVDADYAVFCEAYDTHRV